uniref:Uncharacterized protein n=1 Tax=Arundo donax TaxID=35708 RepID=A0A0A8YAN7_ARUDO
MCNELTVQSKSEWTDECMTADYHMIIAVTRSFLDLVDMISQLAEHTKNKHN